MPWAQAEPEELDQKRERLRSFRGRFDLGIDFIYGIFDSTEKEVIGGTGLHTRQNTTNREIGYWIATPHTRRGYATEVCNALLQVAFRIDQVPRVEIRCDPANVASSGVALKIGMKLDGVMRGDTVTPSGSVRDTAVYSAQKGELESLPTSNLVVQAFDVVGERLI